MNCRVYVNFKRVAFLLLFIPMMIQGAESDSEERRGFWKRFWSPTKESNPKESDSSEIPKAEGSKDFSLLEGTLQVRAGYFQFTSNWAKKIYGKGIPDIELEGSVKIHPNISLWSNLNYVWKAGHSTVFANGTHLDLGTLSLGANLMTPFKRSATLVYVGLGISGAYVHTKDHTAYLPTDTSKLGVGCVAKLGIFISCIKHVFLNPFFDYYYQPIHTRNSSNHSTVDVGGFRTGLGIGYSFY